MYNLFLDDIRIPTQVYWANLPQNVNWTVVRSYEEFTNIILLQNIPKLVSFDHDIEADRIEGDITDLKKCILKRGKTGYDCALFLVNYCIDKNLAFPEYIVHSVNPVGKQNIESLIQSFIRSNNQ